MQIAAKSLGLLLTLVFLNGIAWAQDESRLVGGNGTLYVGGYAHKIYVIDEATEEVVREIPVSIGMPRRLAISTDRERFFMFDTTFENFEIINVASGESLDTVSMSDSNTTVRIRGFVVDPQERYVIFQVRPATKLIDRFEIGAMKLVKYDLTTHAVEQEIDWPNGKEVERLNMLFSPDGSLLYFFADEVVIYETNNFTEVDRWDMSESGEDGVGPFRFGARDQVNEEPGFFTGLFTVPSAVQGDRLMGVARVNLLEKAVEYFYTLGPATGVSFSLAPDRTKAYGLLSEIGHSEFWTFDLESRRLGPRKPFAGRPRMALKTSSNGKLLYIYQAGQTIDVYEATTYQYLRTIDLEADMTTALLVIPPTGQ
ncbi:MAG TPA: hypothetical protein DD460_04430 [Acidobacteria bacterium]|nr:hypothetical protein [Acidobacteriota bacterium]